MLPVPARWAAAMSVGWSPLFMPAAGGTVNRVVADHRGS